MVVGVLLEVAQLAGRGDPGDDRRPGHRGQLVELGAERGETLFGEPGRGLGRLGARRRCGRPADRLSSGATVLPVRGRAGARRRSRAPGRGRPATGAEDRAGPEDSRVAGRIGPSVGGGPPGRLARDPGGLGTTGGRSALGVGHRPGRFIGQQRAGDAVGLARAVGGLEVGVGQDHRPIVESGRDRARNGGRERLEKGVLVLLDRLGLGPPDAQPLETAQGPQPVPARIRAAVAQRRPERRGEAGSDRDAGGADVEDRLVGQPERAQTGGQLASGRLAAVEGQGGDALDPAADRVEVDRRRGGRLGPLDEVDTATVRADRGTPDRRTVGQQADRAEEGRGAGARPARLRFLVRQRRPHPWRTCRPPSRRPRR